MIPNQVLSFNRNFLKVAQSFRVKCVIQCRRLSSNRVVRTDQTTEQQH